MVSVPVMPLTASVAGFPVPKPPSVRLDEDERDDFVVGGRTEFISSVGEEAEPLLRSPGTPIKPLSTRRPEDELYLWKSIIGY